MFLVRTVETVIKGHFIRVGNSPRHSRAMALFDMFVFHF